MGLILIKLNFEVCEQQGTCKPAYLNFYLWINSSLPFSLEHSSKKEKLILNLSTNSLTAKTCAVLSKVIAADHVFIEYKFADCMLSEDGK